MANSYYQVYFKKLKNKHDPFIQEALNGMIDEGVSQYLEYGTVNRLQTKELARVLFELHLEAGSSWARYTAKAIKTKKAAVDNYLAFMREYLNRHLMDKSVNPISTTERNIMLNVINQGLENGDGPNKIAANLRDLKLGKARSRLIVRTETGRAMNTGAMFAAMESDLVVNKVWNSAQNNRTRRIPRDQADHLRMDGVTVAFDEWFFVPTKTGIDLMQFPCDSSGSASNVCNCRCSVSFVPTGQRRSALVRNEFIDIIELLKNTVTLEIINALNNE